MENPNLQGVFGIVPTPFLKDGEIDISGLNHLIKHCADSGLHAAVVLGSGGEYPFLTNQEKMTVISEACKEADGKIPIVAGVSSFGTKEACELGKYACEKGCEAVMSTLPVYFRLGFEEIKSHFEQIAQVSELPVIFHYYPEVTGMVLSPDEIAEISDIEGIHGAKVSTINRSLMKKIINNTRTNLWAVFAGTSLLLRYTLKRGGAGVICPLPLVAPKDCLSIYNSMDTGKLDEADEIQRKILGAIPLFNGMDVPSNIAVTYFKAMSSKPYTGPPDRMISGAAFMKEALRLQGHPITSIVRSPCPQITDEQSSLVHDTLKTRGWL